jgi:hypothetical protein
LILGRLASPCRPWSLRSSRHLWQSQAPLTFHYKSDATGARQFGLIAEEVAEVNSDLVVRNENGEIYSVRYDAMNAMLLNEFLKGHRKMEQQQAIVSQLQSVVARHEGVEARQQKEIETLAAELKEQAAQIQQVSAQIRMSIPAPQTVQTR